MRDSRNRSSGLTTPELVLAGICLVYPFRIVHWHLSGIDLHLGLVSFAVAGLTALVFVRQAPAGFPNALDSAVLAFTVLAAVEGALLGNSSSHILKGLAVETRFAAFYLFARCFRLRREFGVWLLEATVCLGIAAAVLGALEYHLAWGTLLSLGWIRPTPSFWKLGGPRLYSFPMTPLGTAYLFLFALAAAAGLTAMGRRPRLVAAALVSIWQALPLGLARVPTLFAIGTTAAYAIWDRARGRRFLALSFLAVGLAGLVYWVRGWQGALWGYIAVAGNLSDGSAALHAASAELGLDLMMDQPLGYGLGEAGQLARGYGGVFPFYETHYVTVAIQLGLPGLVCFLWVVLQSGFLWLRTAASSEPVRRALGFTGSILWVAMTLGGLLAPTWAMIVPQLYFWVLTGLAANLAAEGETTG